MPYHVLLVDDHKILRDGIKAILRAEGDFDVVGEGITERMRCNPAGN